MPSLRHPACRTAALLLILGTPAGGSALQAATSLAADAPFASYSANRRADTDIGYLLGRECRMGGGQTSGNALPPALSADGRVAEELRTTYDLGLKYLSGQGGPRDDARAFSLFREAAEKGMPDAQFMLSYLYGNGRGVEKDGTQALYWIRKAAGSGHPQARAILERLMQIRFPGTGK